MSEAAAAQIGILVGLAIGVLVLSFINAWVLSWRAKVLRSWRIPYRSAYVVSVKAVVISLIAGALAAYAVDFVVDFFGSARHGLARTIGALLGIVAWWYAHRSALMKMEVPRIVVWPKDARAISASVFGFVTIILVASITAILATIFVISLFTRSTIN